VGFKLIFHFCFAVPPNGPWLFFQFDFFPCKMIVIGMVRRKVLFPPFYSLEELISGKAIVSLEIN